MNYQSTYSSNPVRDWDAECANRELDAMLNPRPDADEVLADMLRDADTFAENLSEELVCDYYTAHARRFMATTTPAQKRKHDRAAKAISALQAICSCAPDTLTQNERVIRDAIIEAFTERAEQIVEDAR